MALETVALQLADERDRAVAQVAQAQGALEAQRAEDKKVLEVLASQLIQERNAALQDAQELKRTVASLMEVSFPPPSPLPWSWGLQPASVASHVGCPLAYQGPYSCQPSCCRRTRTSVLAL